MLSLSLGGFGAQTSFAALHAVQKGITLVYAGGNEGPSPQTVVNLHRGSSPWPRVRLIARFQPSSRGEKQQIVVGILSLPDPGSLPSAGKATFALGEGFAECRASGYLFTAKAPLPSASLGLRQRRGTT